MEKYREIVVSTGGEHGGEEESLSSSKSQRATGRTKSIHPPIETRWHLPPQQEYKPSNFGFKSIMSFPLKFRDSLTRIGRTKSMQMVLEGAHDPKDEQFVESFRKLLLVDGQPLGKHNDYHTLLRYLFIFYFYCRIYTALIHVSFCMRICNSILLWLLISYNFRFLRMRDFNLSKAKEMFLNYLKWREDFGVDAIPKVNSN
jgi:hypothetical protein